MGSRRDQIKYLILTHCHGDHAGGAANLKQALEVEVIVAEVGETSLAGHERNAIYRIQFDGSISDHQGYCVIGGAADDLNEMLRGEYRADMSLGDALQLGRRALQRASDGQPQVSPENLEVCVLDRNRPGRKFTRLSTDELKESLGSD